MPGNADKNKALDGLIAGVQSQPVLQPLHNYDALINDFWLGKKPETRRAYQTALVNFCSWLTVDVRRGAELLLSQKPGEANMLVLKYRDYLVGKNCASKTINLQLAALKSFVHLAKVQGMVNWNLEVKSLTTSPGQPCGLSEEDINKLLAVARKQAPIRAARDEAIIWLLVTTSFRREEICTLRIKDYDAKNKRVNILGKRRDDRQWCTIPEQAYRALEKWTDFRTLGTIRSPEPWADSPDFLFCSLVNGRVGESLSGKGVWLIIKRLGHLAGLEIHPHMLRHSGGQIGYAKTLDIRAVSKLLRHKDISTTMIYADTHEDVAGKTAQVIADSISKSGEKL
jgi:integrase/recombinase XerD